MDLRRAIDRCEIVPWFQPIVDLRTGLLSGFEVLARWEHPERGIISPCEFIPCAESTALIGPLRPGRLCPST
jgi:EAL domain-containing protein (putative c-di-GMP-specific phosphodiesterase class I)